MDIDKTNKVITITDEFGSISKLMAINLVKKEMYETTHFGFCITHTTENIKSTVVCSSDKVFIINSFYDMVSKMQNENKIKILK